jgi:NADPH-dependent glutamate synthase beta subunit-like oxidoreductase
MRRPRAEAPADPDELRLAEGEGVQILAERRVVEAAGQGDLARVRCERLAYSEPDLVGRRVMRAMVAEPEWLDARVLIAAEDRRPDLAWLGTGTALARGALGNLLVDAASYQTPRKGVFGAGEAVTGARNTVESIATGLRAAAAVARFLEGEAS